MNRNSTTACYHCNSSKKIIALVKHSELVISSHKNDDFWAGAGMYFWDNISNARYWYDQKKKHGEAPANIKIAKIYLTYDEESELLDLTDWETIELVENLAQTLKNKDGKERRIGKIIDEYCKENNCKLVKEAWNYYSKSKRKPEILKGTKITPHIKVIYCLKEGNSDIITRKEYVEEKESWPKRKNWNSF